MTTIPTSIPGNAPGDPEVLLGEPWPEWTTLLPRSEWDAEQVADTEKFRGNLRDFHDGTLEEDTFRVIRLTNGIYGQRQGGTNQMIRVKLPYGSMSPTQLYMMAHIADHYSRGWGHITTRQNLQFHYVQIDQVPHVMELLASVGLTSREACGDAVRNVQGCHLAGACPKEVLDISPWAEATYRHFVRNPLGQRLPRKFKINFSGCETDCGQALFNDAGVIAVTRQRDDGTTERGFRIYIAGGLGANPHPAIALEEFTEREQLLPTIESILRVFDQAGNRDNKLRARMKWLVDTLGIDEVRRRVFQTRKFLPASATWPGGLPPEVVADGDDPAGAGDGPISPIGQGAFDTASFGNNSVSVTPVSIGRPSPYEAWVQHNVVRGASNRTVSAYAHARLGDITAEQFRGLARLQHELDASVRLSNRQNVVFRDLSDDQLAQLYQGLIELNMHQAGAELARDVVSCPGADTCNLAVTQSRGLADAISDSLDEAGLAETGGVRINISGCSNSCGQHHVADIGLFGLERRAHGRSAPGYQLLLGGYLGEEQIHFGQKTKRLPAKLAAEAVTRVVGRYAAERELGETFKDWLDRAGGTADIGRALDDLDQFASPEENPDLYIDYGETGPFEVEVGISECAT